MEMGPGSDPTNFRIAKVLFPATTGTSTKTSWSQPEVKVPSSAPIAGWLFQADTGLGPGVAGRVDPGREAVRPLDVDLEDAGPGLGRREADEGPHFTIERVMGAGPSGS